MSSYSRAFVAAAVAALCFLLLMPTASAAPSHNSSFPTIDVSEIGTLYQMELYVGSDATDPDYLVSGKITVGGSEFTVVETSLPSGGSSTIQVPFSITEQNAGACSNGLMLVGYDIDFINAQTGATEDRAVVGSSAQCSDSSALQPVEVVPPTSNPVCGPDNDEITFYPQLEGVLAPPYDSGWLPEGRVIIYGPAPGYEIANQSQFHFEDVSEPCDGPPFEVTMHFTDQVFSDLEPNDLLTLTASFDLDTEEEYEVTSWVMALDFVLYIPGTTTGAPGPSTTTFAIDVSSPSFQQVCEDGEVYLSVEATIMVDEPGKAEYLTGFTVPCSVNDPSTIITEPLNPPTIVEFCGASNDIVNHALSQPEGVQLVPTRSDYDANNVYTLTYSTLPNYAFAEGYDPTFTHTDPEPEVPCTLVTPTGELAITAVCGYDSTAQANDIVTLVPQEGVQVDQARWLNSLYRINVVPESGYAFTEGAPTEFEHWDTGSLCDEPLLELDDDDGQLIDIAPGESTFFSANLTLPADNPFDYANLILDSDFSTSQGDSIFIPELGDGGVKSIDFLFTTDEDFYESCASANGQIQINVTVELKGPNGVERTLSDSGTFTCAPLQPVTPDPSLIQQIRVCGDNNDSVETTQEGVIVSLSDWSENEATATFSPAPGYTFVGEAPAPFGVSDDGPCIVDFVALPDLEAVCGPDNDIYTSPDQPEGVVVTDSGWSNNQRTITLAPADGYAFPGGENYSRTYTDSAIPCDSDPEGKQVTVILLTSDGGSIEGSRYTLHAPMASQASMPPYAEGQVGPNNRIVFPSLIAGDYRLLIEADGYETLNETITVSDGADSQEITLEVRALQVEQTPTPVGTPVPQPTTDATETPVNEPAEVSGLPETGTGEDGSRVLVGFVTILALAMAAGFCSLRLIRR